MLWIALPTLPPILKKIILCTKINLLKISIYKYFYLDDIELMKNERDT